VQEVCFWLVLRRGFLPAEAYSRVADTHCHTLGMPLLVWGSSHTDLGPEEKSLHGHQNLMCQFEVLRDIVQGLCLHSPENWFVGQLIDL
jgi:hypothetical protein